MVAVMPKTNSLRGSRFEVSVTAADIDRAFRSNSAECVVAQAIARTLPDACRIEVDTQTIRFTMGQERYAYLTPYSVTGYVIGFDAGDTIQPFRFRLYEDQRVPIRSRRRTPEGRAAQLARETAREAKKRAKAAQQKLEAVLDETQGAFTDPSLPPPTPAQVAAVKAEVRAADAAAKAATQQADAVKAAHADSPTWEPRSPGRDVPRVFKTKRREYGNRVLRINQQTSD